MREARFGGGLDRKFVMVAMGHEREREERWKGVMMMIRVLYV